MTRIDSMHHLQRLPMVNWSIFFISTFGIIAFSPSIQSLLTVYAFPSWHYLNIFLIYYSCSNFYVEREQRRNCCMVPRLGKSRFVRQCRTVKSRIWGLSIGKALVTWIRRLHLFERSSFAFLLIFLVNLTSNQQISYNLSTLPCRSHPWFLILLSFQLPTDLWRLRKLKSLTLFNTPAYECLVRAIQANEEVSALPPSRKLSRHPGESNHKRPQRVSKSTLSNISGISAGTATSSSVPILNTKTVLDHLRALPRR